jgi:hypothetical protein
MRALKLVLLSGCLLTLVGILALRSFSRASLESVGVVLVGQSTNEAKVRFALLEITNQGPYRICLPDSCSVQTGATSKWVYTRTTDLWLEPSKATCISVPAPGSSNEWRVSVGYYAESPWNRLKMRLGASRLEPKLPRGLVSVKGAAVLSPWIAR